MIYDEIDHPENLLLEMETNWINQNEQLSDPNSLEIDFGHFFAVDNRSNLLKK